VAYRSAAVELLEQRRMLSAASHITVQPDDVYLRSAATTSTAIQGYTPSQIASAYGFNTLSFSNGAVAAQGQGQTIAIIDAYNDPNITSDLGVFDSQFGIAAPPSFQVVNQTGGSKLPTNNPGWDGEISLDVEWAHAMAPQANIMLVEANSDSLTDLLAAVNYARNAAGVSVVSMSWGGSEFFSWSNGEFDGETQYDTDFTTPSGHEGVTFIAAAGDSGAQSGVQWPAASPNVVAVGGTTLEINSDGTYGSESSWLGTSGGYSQIEVEPSYQSTVQGSGVRTVPDVSYDADPNTGFAVYDSVNDEGYVGWQEVGGTSAGAPQWAAIVAIADQGRKLAGLSTLDGPSQTLAALYDTYTATSTSYNDTFNDIVDTGGGGYHFRWGGYGDSNNPATVGYDTATGLGTPKVGGVISALVAYDSSSGTGGTGGTGGGGTGNSGGTTEPASPIIGTIISQLPSSVLVGTDGSVKIRLTNTSQKKFTGPIDITIYASANESTTGAAAIGTLDIAKVTLAGDGYKTIKVKYDYPSTLSSGNYNMIASIAATGTDTSPASAFAAYPVAVSAPTVDLADAFDVSYVPVTPGTTQSVSVAIQNLGNIAADGSYSVSLYSSDTTTLDSSSVLLDTSPQKTIKLKSGASKIVRISFTAPADAQPGTYYLVAKLNPVTTPADSKTSDEIAAVPTF
jgi:subtilase family serine protease